MRDKRERFVSLAEARTEKAIRALRLIGNLSDKRNYSYTPAEVKQIVSALEKELRSIRYRFGEDSALPGEIFKLR